MVLRATPDRYLLTRWWWEEALVLALALAVLAAAVLADPSDTGIRLLGVEVPDLCLYHRLTGWRCPGCGLTRSFAFLGEGKILDAFRLHPLGPPLFLGVALQVPWRGLKMALGPGWRNRLRQRPSDPGETL